ncbi:MAG: alpha/beta hydrolase [Tenacibaculum sp.]|nr:alpha/beta hydrolase [Tenacibaculum sp.]
MELQSGKNRIHFISKTMAGNLKLSGDLYIPTNFNASNKYPTVVFTGPFNQVKEQTGAVYGKKLSQKGYIVLAFDHQGYGDSEGVFRHIEHVPSKINGIQDAVSYLGTLDFVDNQEIYGLGVCAGAGHMAYTVVTDKRIKKVAFVSGMLANNIVHWFAGKKTIQQKLIEANEARQKYYETEEYNPIDVLDMANSENAKVRDQREGYDYYMTDRAGKETYPNYTHKTPAFFLEADARYDARNVANKITTPSITIYGSKASTKMFSWLFNFKKKRPKKSVSIKGATHVDLYDVDKYVDQVVERLTNFFTKA